MPRAIDAEVVVGGSDHDLSTLLKRSAEHAPHPVIVHLRNRRLVSAGLEHAAGMTQPVEEIDRRGDTVGANFVEGRKRIQRRRGAEQSEW